MERVNRTLTALLASKECGKGRSRRTGFHPADSRSPDQLSHGAG